jgi:hypothetical protein
MKGNCPCKVIGHNFGRGPFKDISQLTDQGTANVHFWGDKKCAKPWNQRCTS